MRRTRHELNGLAQILTPIENGWAITLPDGCEVARFVGPTAKQRALRYVVTHNIADELDRHSADRSDPKAQTRGRAN